MRKTETDRLLEQLNSLQGLAYPEVGYSYFADIKGDGRNIRSVYTIISPGGGVTYSGMNAASPRERCRNIRAVIERTSVRRAVEAEAARLDATFQASRARLV